MPHSSSSEDQLPVAGLVIVNFEKLQQKDPSEEAKLYSACVEWGFFYLDLGNVVGSIPDQDNTKKLFEVSEKYFSQDLAEKLKDTRDEASVFNICGYKPMSLDQGNEKNKKDGCEGLRLPTDLLHEAVADQQIYIPEGIKKDWPTVTTFMNDSTSICNTILSSLSDSINLQGEQRLENSHKSTSSSTSTAVLQCYPTDLPPDTSQGHFTHTDAGSISVLYSSNWGLQVYPPGEETWKYVAPRENCAIINVGDSLRFLSKQRLKSCLHRVVPCEKYWKSEARYSVIFFLRPNNDATFVDSEGTHWTGKQWLDSKFGNYRKEHDEQNKSMATGKKGFLGLWSS